MRRIFGAPKKKEPPPTLEQAGANLDSRGTRIDEQIKKLDQQLMGFREQIKKTRPGPAQEALKRRALTVRSRFAHPCSGPTAVGLSCSVAAQLWMSVHKPLVLSLRPSDERISCDCTWHSSGTALTPQGLTCVDHMPVAHGSKQQGCVCKLQPPNYVRICCTCVLNCRFCGRSACMKTSGRPCTTSSSIWSRRASQ